MLNNFKILTGLLIVVAGFAYWVTQTSQNSEEESTYLMPSWQGDGGSINKISRVELQQGDETIALVKSEDYWQIEEGFFADVSPLSDLIQTLKNAEIVEAKTKNPENHSQLELADDDLRVVLFQNDQPMHGIHIGKSNNSGHVFVRREGENQTYTVSGLMKPTFNQNNWVLSTVIDKAAEEILSVTFEPTEGDAFQVNRSAETQSLVVSDLAENETTVEDAKLENLMSGLSRLVIDEALPVDLTDKVQKSTISYALQDGEQVVVNLYQQDETYYMTLSGDNLQKYAPWMMKIAAYKFDALNKKREDIVQMKASNDETVEAETEDAS